MDANGNQIRGYSRLFAVFLWHLVFGVWCFILRPVKQFATITVIGRDKTGVVARITSFLFEQRANIEALEEQVTRGQFSMTVQSSWKTGHLDRSALATGLERLA